jgi:hypothetical protein
LQYSFTIESAPEVNNHGCLGWNKQSITPVGKRTEGLLHCTFF